MTDLAIYRIEHWTTRFLVMLTLSVVVAVMGLSLDSAAVVIGAMLLAPLMQPVLAAGACLSMALFTKSLIAVAKVAGATAWSIGIAYLLSLALPDSTLTSEVLARTQPDIKDLAVALAAGAAGAYATVQEDVSSSLPGVAVAVALVPPLGSVGIALELGSNSLAFGALLLYFTNLAAILFASIVVFVLTGFVPPRRLSDNLLRLTTAGVGLVALVIVVAVPLYRASIDSIERNDEQLAVEAIVDEWLSDTASQMERTVSIDRETNQFEVVVRGLAPPLDQGPLLEDLRARFPDASVTVQWIQSQQATTTTLPPTEQLVTELETAVLDWLENSGLDFQLDAVRLDGNLVRIDAAGLGPPPDVDDLLPRLASISPVLQPGLNWVTLATITEETVPTPLELAQDRLLTAMTEWAAPRQLVVRSLDFDGQRVEMELAGAVEPNLVVLERAVLEALEVEEIPIEVFFIQRNLVTTTVPTDVTVSTL